MNYSCNIKALEIIPKLRESMKIDRAEMRLRVSVEAKEAKRMHDRLKGMFTKIEVEDWEQGNLEMVKRLESSFSNFRTFCPSFLNSKIWSS